MHGLTATKVIDSKYIKDFAGKEFFSGMRLVAVGWVMVVVGCGWLR